MGAAVGGTGVKVVVTGGWAALTVSLARATAVAELTVGAGGGGFEAGLHAARRTRLNNPARRTVQAQTS